MESKEQGQLKENQQYPTRNLACAGERSVAKEESAPIES